jgi:hypothetical protein
MSRWSAPVSIPAPSITSAPPGPPTPPHAPPSVPPSSSPMNAAPSAAHSTSHSRPRGREGIQQSPADQLYQFTPGSSNGRLGATPPTSNHAVPYGTNGMLIPSRDGATNPRGNAHPMPYQVLVWPQDVSDDRFYATRLLMIDVHNLTRHRYHPTTPRLWQVS